MPVVLTLLLPLLLVSCRFGAEESGLSGSRYHVAQASLRDRPPGDRIADYAAMNNYDSIASPNGFYAVYDATELPSSTPARAVPGSRVISSLHFSYFAQRNLPSEPTGMGGGSDYVGFLEAGIACGGLYGGLTEVKSRDLRDRYDALLGAGRGGVANAQLDPCYHKYCDDVQNINQLAYLDMARSAAFTVASMALHPQLRAFLQYPPSQNESEDDDGRLAREAVASIY
jgi:Zn-dependent M28 family amino/carboxypeptidase